MSGQTDPKAEWVRRVLGITVGAARADAAPKPGAPPNGNTAARWQAARAGWLAAGEAADGQIAELQKVLRASGDDTLAEIAEFGLNGITGNLRVPLAAALIELGAGDPAAMQKAGPKALGIIGDYRKFLDTSEAIEVCDGNPFGAKVALRATLGGALQELAATLEAGLGTKG